MLTPIAFLWCPYTLFLLAHRVGVGEGEALAFPPVGLTELLRDTAILVEWLHERSRELPGFRHGSLRSNETNFQIASQSPAFCIIYLQGSLWALMRKAQPLPWQQKLARKCEPLFAETNRVNSKQREM